MVQAMGTWTPEEKALCLRTMINSQALLYKSQVNAILMGAADQVLNCLKEKETKLTEVDSLRILATIMRNKKETMWFNAEDAGNNSFLIPHCFPHLNVLYRVAQNLGKQVLRTHYLKFHSLSSDFAVFTHGERDLHSLPWMAGAAVQISLK